MTSRAGRKGYSGENEVVKFFRHLKVKVQRAFGSDGRAMGEASDIDVRATVDDLILLIQVKRYKKFSIYKFFKNANVVALRGDNQKWLYVVTEDLMGEIVNRLKSKEQKDER
tara:strand:- start:1112 stop:1447 length:336 start_codon:yes stop_codon:yes gene_type:complete